MADENGSAINAGVDGKKILSAANHAASSIKKLNAFIGDTSTLIQNFTQIATAKTDNIKALASATALSTENVQEWLFAIKNLGLDAKAVMADVAALAASGTVSGDMHEHLLGIAGQVQQKGAGAYPHFAQDTLSLFANGPGAITALHESAAQSGAIIPNEQFKALDAFEQRTKSYATAIQSIVEDASMQLAIGLSELMKDAPSPEEMHKSASAGTQEVINGFKQFGEHVQFVTDAFKPYASDLQPVLDFFSELGSVSDLVSGALLGISLLLVPMFVKFCLITAAVGGLSLALNDLFNFLSGKESHIGKFFDGFTERYPELSDALKNFASLPKEMAEGLSDFGKPIYEYFATFNKEFPHLTKLATDLVEVFGVILAFVVNKTAEAFRELGSTLKGGLEIMGLVVKETTGAVDKMVEDQKHQAAPFEERFPFAKSIGTEDYSKLNTAKEAAWERYRNYQGAPFEERFPFAKPLGTEDYSNFSTAREKGAALLDEFSKRIQKFHPSSLLQKIESLSPLGMEKYDSSVRPRATVPVSTNQVQNMQRTISYNDNRKNSFTITAPAPMEAANAVSGAVNQKPNFAGSTPEIA